MNPTSVAAAQTLSGEKLSRTVTVPCTGDPELDLIAALITICHEAQKDGLAVDSVARALEYSLARANAKLPANLFGKWKFETGQLATPQDIGSPPQNPPQIANDPRIGWPYGITSGGTLGPNGEAFNDLIRGNESHPAVKIPVAKFLSQEY